MRKVQDSAVYLQSVQDLLYLSKMSILDDLGIDSDDFHWKDLASCRNAVQIIVNNEHGEVMRTEAPGNDIRLKPGETKKLFDPMFDGYESDSPPYPVRYAVDEMCRNCPVRQECLEEGLTNDGFGVWGGLYLSWGKIDQTNNAHKDWSVWDELSVY